MTKARLPGLLRRHPLNASTNEHIEVNAELADIAEQMESEQRVKTPHASNYNTVSERDKSDRDRDRHPQTRQKELPRVWSSDREELLANQSPSDYDSKSKGTDRSNPSTTRRRKPQKSVDVQAGPDNDAFNADYEPTKEDVYATSSPHAYLSNSLNTTEIDPPDADDIDYRNPASIKNTSRILNAAKYVFTREAKSRSNNTKSSRSANTKLSSGPAIASIKKFLQTSTTKPSGSSNNSFTKSFEEAPSVKTLSFSAVGDPRPLTSEQQSAFKKPTKDFSFTRGIKPGGTFSGYSHTQTPPDERGNTSRGDN